MIVWVAARMLSSSIEYLSVHLYNSSIVSGGSKDSDWKNGVDDPKLLLSYGGSHPCCKILSAERLAQIFL